MIETREQCIEFIGRLHERLQNCTISRGDGALPDAASHALAIHNHKAAMYAEWIGDFQHLITVAEPFRFSSITYRQLAALHEWLASRAHVLEDSAAIVAGCDYELSVRLSSMAGLLGETSDELDFYMAKVRMQAPWVIA